MYACACNSLPTFNTCSHVRVCVSLWSSLLLPRSSPTMYSSATSRPTPLAPPSSSSRVLPSVAGGAMCVYIHICPLSQYPHPPSSTLCVLHLLSVSSFYALHNSDKISPLSLSPLLCRAIFSGIIATILFEMGIGLGMCLYLCATNCVHVSCEYAPVINQYVTWRFLLAAFTAVAMHVYLEYLML